MKTMPGLNRKAVSQRIASMTPPNYGASMTAFSTPRNG